MDEYKLPFCYANKKFPGFIGLTYKQFLAIRDHNLKLALALGISYNDYMSLLYKDFPKK